jgi:hypothetical protein
MPDSSLAQAIRESRQGEFPHGLHSMCSTTLGEAMFQQRIGVDLRHGRKPDPRDALAICVYVVAAAAIGALLSPLAVMCALLVIAVEMMSRLFEAEQGRRPAVTVIWRAWTKQNTRASPPPTRHRSR